MLEHLEKTTVVEKGTQKVSPLVLPVEIVYCWLDGIYVCFGKGPLSSAFLFKKNIDCSKKQKVDTE